MYTSCFRPEFRLIFTLNTYSRVYTYPPETTWARAKPCIRIIILGVYTLNPENTWVREKSCIQSEIAVYTPLALTSVALSVCRYTAYGVITIRGESTIRGAGFFFLGKKLWKPSWFFCAGNGHLRGHSYSDSMKKAELELRSFYAD